MAMKRKTLSIEMKIRLLADVDKKVLPKKEIALKYGIPHNTLSTIIKNKRKNRKPDKRTVTREKKTDII